MRKRMLAAAAAVGVAASGLVAVVAVGSAAANAAAASDTPDEIQQVPAKITNIRPLLSGEWEATVVIGPIVAKAHDHDEPGQEPAPDPGHPHAGVISPMHGPDAPMHGAHTTARATISNSFCLGCYTTGVTPDLVYADGSRADIDTGVMLHHSVLGEKGGLDHTCQSPEFRERFGKRVYASGNERTGAHLPAGFGMKTSGADLVVEIELMNMTDQPKTVYHTLKTTVANPFFSFMMKRVEPVWLDQAGCDSASEFPVPVGESRHTWEWTSTISGTVKAVGGHLHDGGQTLTVSNAATGKVLCAMTAEYGTKPSSMGHLDKMTPVCTGTLGTVKRGEKLRQDSTYHIKYADPGAMAISLVYIAPY
ncbi:hypothetical protein GCM10023148_13430 [Actinokineospora soli]